MTSNRDLSLKLKNPTQYHILASAQGQEEQPQSATFTEESYNQQPFLSPISSSTPIQDFDDFETTSQYEHSSSFNNNMMDHTMMFVPEQMHYQHYQQQQQQQQQTIMPVLISNNSRGNMNDFVPAEESLSDYSSSYDMFSTGSSYPANHYPPNAMGWQHMRHDSMNSQSAADELSPTLSEHTFSAPANIGYGFRSGGPGHMLYNQAISPANRSAHPEPRSLEEFESVQISHQILTEKKRRRRESHNAVERRRRENINERIQELGTMLPEDMLEELANVNTNGIINKPNKGAILSKSVDHIRILQQEVVNHKQRILDLEHQLTRLSTATSSTNSL